MIERVRFRNFKSLRDVTIPLERFTVLVGPNASGKTSVLQGLDRVCRSFAEQERFDGREVSGSRSSGSDGEVELAVQLREGPAYRHRSSEAEPANGHRRSGSPREEAESIDSQEWQVWKKGPVGCPLPRVVLLRLELSRLLQPAAPPQQSAMTPEGNGLHAVLASLRLNDPDAWQALENDLRKIVPTIRRLRFTVMQPNQPVSLLFDAVGASSLTAAQVSEGTMLTLGLLATLYAFEPPDLLLLDDMDRALHPLSQVDLVKLLREMLDAKPNLQIIASTHSPYMLDSMKPEEVRLLSLKEDGSTACAPLGTHPKFDRWKTSMGSGELWSVFGEKWVTQPQGALA